MAETSQSNVAIGPWSGINNVRQAGDRVFQGSADGNRPALVAASNVDLNDDGWPRSRTSLTIDVSLIEGLGGWNIAGRLFFQDGSTLYERTEDGDTALIHQLSGRVMMAAHWGKIYLTDGLQHWEMEETTVRPWGLPVPTLANLTQADGALYAPGQYLVRASFSDARGNEGGVSAAYAIELSAIRGTPTVPVREGGLSLSVGNLANNVARINLYVSEVNQKMTSFADSFDVDEFDSILIDEITTIGDPPRTEFMQGPIASAQGVFSFRAFLLMWRDNVVFRSEAAQPHLFHALGIMQFPEPVVAAEGLAGGLWIATEGGLWWVTGDAPEQWIPVCQTHAAVLPGSMVVSGSLIPPLQTTQPVALFVTAMGLLAGMPDGGVRPLTEDIYRFPTGARASFCYAERNDLHQLLIGIVEN